MLSVTPAYAAILAILFLVLSFRVIGARREARVSIGDGGQSGLLRRQRVHANFAEYAPFCLLLIAMAEIQGAPALLVHALGAGLLAGRMLHAYGLAQQPETFTLRVAGMVLTTITLAIAALTNLALSLMTLSS